MKALTVGLLFVAGLLGADGGAVSFRASNDFSLTADPSAEPWRDIRGVTFENGRYGEPVAGHLTEVRSRWTVHNLYFLFTCSYQSLNLRPGPPLRGETNELWNWDVAEVFIGSDFENIQKYKEFEVSPRGEWVDLSIELDPAGQKHKINWLWNSGFEMRTRVDAGRKIWFAEMRIPMSSITEWKPAPGRAFRINFYRIQGKPPKFLAWRPVSQEWFHNPRAFGQLLLSE